MTSCYLSENICLGSSVCLANKLHTVFHWHTERSKIQHTGTYKNGSQQFQNDVQMNYNVCQQRGSMNENVPRVFLNFSWFIISRQKFLSHRANRCTCCTPAWVCHCVSIYPVFRLGPVYRGQFGEVLSFLRPTVHTIIECRRFPGTITVEWFSAVRTGCALGHRATTIRACAHLMKTAAQYQLRAQGRSFVPGPNKFGGITGRSPGERPHYGIAGESPGKRELMWTQS